MDHGRGGDAVYDFAEFRLVAAQRRLLSRADGRPIELSQKAFDALLYFVTHRGELLDKAVLIKAIWPNVVVEENNLNQVISALRRALGDGGGDNRLIVTVPGRGYQFTPAVAESTSDELASIRVAPPPERQATASAAPARKASIAVLPFASLSGDPEKDYFGDGIAEELIHLLARVPGLKVPARTSSFAYKGRNTDARQIARDLGVAMLLEGSVRSAGERIRVTAQLIEAESGFHVWSETYDRQFADVFQLQDELAGAIVQALKINLSGRPSVREAPPTSNLEAYRLFMQVRGLWGRALAGPTAVRVLDLLNRIVELDPGFARAHSSLAYLQFAQFSLGLRGPEILGAARRSAERALSLDPRLENAHQAMAVFHAAQGQWLAADAAAGRSIELDPDEPSSHAAYANMILGPAGMLDQALHQAREAYRLGPGFAGSAVTLAGYYSFNELEAEAVEQTQVAVDLGFPEQQPPLPIFRYQGALRAGRYEEACSHILKVVPDGILAQGGEEAVQKVFEALADSRRSSAAVSALRALSRKGDPIVFGSWPMAVLIYNWYAMMGAFDDAFEVVQRVVDNFHRSGVVNVLVLPPLWLPELKTFRRDARFGRVVADLGMLDYWKVHGPPVHCDIKDGRLIVR
jgi:TolB-like protein/tetratricopeptide (TPR) repeat protein